MDIAGVFDWFDVVVQTSGGLPKMKGTGCCFL